MKGYREGRYMRPIVPCLDMINGDTIPCLAMSISCRSF